MDTSIFTDVVRLASLAKQPISLEDLDLNAQEEYKKPRRDFLADIINKEMEKTMRRDFVKMFSEGDISPASLSRVQSCMKLVNQRLVNATQDRNANPVVDFDADGNLVKLRPSLTFVDTLLEKPNECLGYSIWELIHAVTFDENPKLASAYEDMNRTGGFLDLDRLERDSPMDTKGLKKLFEPALYRLAYVNKNNYVGESAIPGTRKEQHRSQCANKEGINTAVADLNMKEIPYRFEIFHRFRLGATLFERLALESSIIACAGTSLATIPGREGHRRLQFNPISPMLGNQLDCPFSLWTIRTSYVHYLVMAYSEREANRSKMPSREWRPHDKLHDRYTQAWKIILGPDIVSRIEEEGWTVQKYLAVVLFHAHARPLRDQLDKFYGAPDRLWTTERMYPLAGKIKGRSKEVQMAERVARVDNDPEQNIQRKGKLPSNWTPAALNGIACGTSPERIEELVSDWKAIHALRSAPANRDLDESKWSPRELNKLCPSVVVSSVPSPSTGPATPPAEFREVMASVQQRHLARENHSMKMHYINSVAEHLYMQGSPGHPSGYGRRIKRSFSKDGALLGLIDLLNAPGNHFTLEEVYDALENSQTFVRGGSRNNVIKIHPAALARELQVRMQACRLAAQQHGIGNEASDGFIAYLAHPIGVCWRHWLWPCMKYSQGAEATSGKKKASGAFVPNYLYRYDPDVVPPSIQEMEQVVEERLLAWGCNQDDIRGAIQFDSKNWKGVVAGILAEVFPAVDIFACNLLGRLKQESTEYPPWDFSTLRDQAFKTRCDRTREERYAKYKAITEQMRLDEAREPVAEDCTRPMRSQLSYLALDIWNVTQETFLAWLDFPNHRGHKSSHRDPKRVFLRAMLRLFQGQCPAYNLSYEREVDIVFSTAGLFEDIDRARLPFSFVFNPADRIVLETVLDEVAETQTSPWDTLAACQSEQQRALRRNAILRSVDVFEDLYTAYCRRKGALVQPYGSDERRRFRAAVGRYLSWHLTLPDAEGKEQGMAHWQSSELVTVAEIWRYFGNVPEGLEIASRATSKNYGAFLSLAAKRPDIFLDATLGPGLDDSKSKTKGKDVRAERDADEGPPRSQFEGVGGVGWRPIETMARNRSDDAQEEADELGAWQDDDGAGSYSGSSDIIGEWQE